MSCETSVPMQFATIKGFPQLSEMIKILSREDRLKIVVPFALKKM